MAAIAEKVGVSTVTVSRALRGIGRMKPSTRDAIRATAKEIGYPVNDGVLKRASRSRGTSEFRPRLLLPMFHVLEEKYFQPARSRSHQELLAGIRERLERNHGETEEPHVENVEEVIALCRRQRITGMVIQQPLPQAWMQRLRPLAPMVMAGPHDNYSELSIDGVHMDETRSSAKIVDYLYAFGHRQIAWFGILDKGGITDRIAGAIDPQHASDRLLTSSHTMRYAAWAGLAWCQPPRQTMPMLLLERDWRHQPLREIMANGLGQLLALRPQPTAVVVASGYMASELMALCAERGIKIPADLSVVSYGDEKQLSLPCTRIDISHRLIGQTAVELLERRLSMPDAAAMMLLLEADLRIGQTVAAPRSNA